MVTHGVTQCIAEAWERTTLRLCCGTLFLGIPALDGGPYGDECGLSVCILGRSGCSQCPGTGNVAACSVRLRHGLSSSIQAQTSMVLPEFSAPGSLAVICSSHMPAWVRCSPQCWKEILAANGCTGPLPTAGLSTGATCLGRNVTKVATCGGLLHPGGLGTSDVSQLCGSCSSSSPILSARHVLDVDGHGKDV